MLLTTFDLPEMSKTQQRQPNRVAFCRQPEQLIGFGQCHFFPWFFVFFCQSLSPFYWFIQLLHFPHFALRLFYTVCRMVSCVPFLHLFVFNFSTLYHCFSALFCFLVECSDLVFCSFSVASLNMDFNLLLTSFLCHFNLVSTVLCIGKSLLRRLKPPLTLLYCFIILFSI